MTIMCIDKLIQTHDGYYTRKPTLMSLDELITTGYSLDVSYTSNTMSKVLHAPSRGAFLFTVITRERDMYIAYRKQMRR